MPRDKFVIQTYDKGILSGADQSDIQDGAAAWSIEENPASIPGTVQPRMTDTVFNEATANVYCAQCHAWITRAGNQRDLILYNARSGRIDAVSDFHGTPAYAAITSATPGTGLSMSLRTINRAVRMGWGDNASKYVGYVDHAPFGGAVSTTLQYVNAELSKASEMPKPYKIVGTTTIGYGIEFTGTRIYKFTLATGAFTTSDDVYVSLQGICYLDDTTDYIYVFDAGASTYGTVYKLDTNMAKVATYPVGGFGATGRVFGYGQAGKVTDIELGADQAYLWFCGRRTDDAAWTMASGATTQWLFSQQVSAFVANTEFVPTNRTPYHTSLDLALGTTATFGGSGDATSTPVLTAETATSPAYYTVTVTNVSVGEKISIVVGATTIETAAAGGGDTNASMVTQLVPLINADTTMGALVYAVDYGDGSYDVYLQQNTAGTFDQYHTAATQSHLSPLRCMVRMASGSDVGVLMDFNYTRMSFVNGAPAVIGACLMYLDHNFSSAGTGLFRSTYCNVVDLGTTIPDSAIYMTGSSTPDNHVLLLTYGTTMKALKCDTSEHPNLTETDMDWLRSAPLSFGTSNTETLKDTMTEATIIFAGFSTNYLFWVFNTETDGTVGNTTPRYYKYQTTDIAAFTGAAAYTKRADMTIGASESSDTTGTLAPLTRKYYYRVVIRYQYSQGSPIQQDTEAESIVLATGTTAFVDVAILSTLLNTRVTGLDLFRAESTEDETTPTTAYRQVGTADFTQSVSSATDANFGGTYYIYRFIDTGTYGPSYEAEFGVPESLPNNTMDYTISATGAGYHFVSQGFNDELEEVKNVVFRSKRNMPDTFDWSNDFCVLPTMPIALHYFKGYLYAFDNSTMYVIEPEALVLVGEYKGYGVQSDLALCSNENAMFFANENHIYQHDGKQPQIISYPIQQVGSTITGATSHVALAATRTIQLAISAKFNCLVAAYMRYDGSISTINSTPTAGGSGYQVGNILTITTGSGTATATVATIGGSGEVTGITLTTAGTGYSVGTGQATSGGDGTSCTIYVNAINNDASGVPTFLFHLDKRAWYYWLSTNVSGSYIDYTTADKRSLVIDYLGRPFITAYKGILHLGGSTTGKTCTWYSKQMNFGDDTTSKKVYFVYVDGSTSTQLIGYDGTTPATAFTSGTQLTSSTTKRKTMQLGFTLADTKILKGITIIFRHLAGLR